MTLEAASEPWLALAKSRDPTDREALLSNLVGFCETRPERLEPAPAAELEAVLLTLANDAGHGVRVRLAERLAAAAWPPPRLIEALAFDGIEVAGPVIAASPRLGDDALLRLVAEATLAHRIEVAQRPRLAAAVVSAVIDRDEPAVLTALAGNRTAEITPSSMTRLVAKARAVAALGAPLAAHPRMSAALAQDLYLWVGEAPRRSIVARFDVDALALDAAMAATPPAAKPPNDGPTAGELKLVEKLAGAGQLNAGFLVRVLMEHRLGLYEAALARLGGFRVEDVHHAVMHPSRPELMALACAAVDIDRSAFPPILAMVRQCTDGLPGGGEEGARLAASAFGPFAPDIAASAFRQTVTAV